MISKVYENKYGLIKWNCITSDLEVAKTDTIYLANKATGSLIINIQEPSNSLIWNNENKEWIPYAVNGEGISDEEVKALAGEKVQELIDSGEIIPDKSINASTKIINGSITQELLDENIKFEISEENIKNLAGDKVNELISTGELQTQIITDKSINASEKIVDGTITKELLDDNIKLEISGNIENIEAVDGMLNLRKGNLYANIQNNTTINLPSTTEYMEIRLWFKCTEDLSIVFPEVAWQNEPESNAGYIYEYIFTYIPEFGTWVGGFVSYEVVI